MASQVGQAPAAVPEGVLEVVALAGQAIEGLVLDLPASPCEAGDLGHVLGRDVQAGEEGVVVGALAAALDLELDPSSLGRICAVTDREVVHPAIAVQLALAVAVARVDPAGRVGEVCVDQFV